MSELLYKKVGRRYVPVSCYAPECLDALPKGAHLIMVDDQWAVRKYNVDPDRGAVMWAIELHRDALLRAISGAGRLKPRSGVPFTEAQHTAWKAFEKEMGGCVTTLQGPSASYILDALSDAIIEATK